MYIVLHEYENGESVKRKCIEKTRLYTLMDTRAHMEGYIKHLKEAFPEDNIESGIYNKI